jgi:hypothetical protein
MVFLRFSRSLLIRNNTRIILVYLRFSVDSFTCICMGLCSEARYYVATGSNNRIYTECSS